MHKLNFERKLVNKYTFGGTKRKETKLFLFRLLYIFDNAQTTSSNICCEADVHILSIQDCLGLSKPCRVSGS